METRYSRAQKEQAFEAFKKQLENGSVASGQMQELSKKLNIPINTLYGWKVDFKKKLVKNGDLNPKTSKFSPQDKFQVIVDTNSMSELEVGEYLRKHGILKEELNFWKKQMEDAFNNAPRIDPNVIGKELANSKANEKRLEKELRYKEKALAEAAALLVLQKKAQAIWGEHGDD